MVKMVSEGKVVDYVLSRHLQHPKNVVLVFNGVNSESIAAKLIGRTVIWVSRGGRQLRGKIVSCHGRNGAVRVRFKRGLPGEALGSTVKLADPLILPE
ncbi:MAG: 50S ribosomal protein L35ae [Candidatus Freyarchaeota archaeon]|nr:50S ribosomal protein L35ae [Candidatus Freyrarchaeum guaymaensis]